MKLLYVDEHLVIIEKPFGVLAVPGRGADKQSSVASTVQRLLPDALIVHRLDRDTSGLMVMARGFEMQRRMSRQFEERLVEKRYAAVVYGRVVEGCGRIELPLCKDFECPPMYCVDFARGRPAATDWRVIERLSDRTRLELVPLTGRSHQLRVHLQHIGHPILGDALYAHEAALGMAERMLLHATRLSFAHPATSERVAWTSISPF